MGFACFFKKLLIGTAVTLLLSYCWLPIYLHLVNLKKLKPCPEFVGGLSRNHILDSAERLYEGKLGVGPESIAIHNGEIYTGVWDSRILKVSNSNIIEEIARVGPKECSLYEAWSVDRIYRRECGYPLGKRFDKSGDLVVADMYKGVYKINIKTGAISTLVSPETTVDGVTFRLANDLDIAKDGDVYFTEVSTKWNFDSPLWLKQFDLQPEGRILHYDAQTKKVRTVVDDLYFPNGIQLSPDEDFLIFAQASTQNIMKFYLKGPKQGQREYLLDSLPGFVDNIRPSGRGTYWVAIHSPRIPDKMSLWEQSYCPLLKIIMYTVFEVASQSLRIAKTYIPIPVLDTLHRAMQEFIPNSIFNPWYGLVIEFNLKGEIIRSLHSPAGNLYSISQVNEFNGHLYFSSPNTNFIGKIKLPN